MTNSTIAPEPVARPGAGVPFFHWEVSGKPVSVYLSLDLMDRLEREVIDSFRAITKRGSEIGGFLLGRQAPSGERAVYIEDWEPLACEYSRGPLYLLSDKDKQHLADALQKLGRTSPLAVVGFMRSNTRKDLSLDEDDLSLLQDRFRSPENVFLLVKPFAMRPSLAGFFIWEDGRIQADAPYLSFPFRSAELVKKFAEAIVGPDAHQPAAEARPPAPLVMPRREDLTPPAPLKPGPVLVPPAVPLSFKREPRPHIAPVLPQPDGEAARAPASSALAGKPEPRPDVPPLARREECPVTPASRDRQPAADKEELSEKPAPTTFTPEEPAAAGPAAVVPAPVLLSEQPAAAGRLTAIRRVGIVAAAVLLLAGAFSAYLWMRTTPPATAAAPDNSLGLKVERNAGQLVLSWNRSAPLIAAAQRATLTINDGEHQEDVDLDLGALRTGSIVYSPMTNDVSMRLEVTDLKRGKSLSESVRVLAGRPSPSVPITAQTAPAQPPAASPAEAPPLDGAPAAALPVPTTPAEEPLVSAAPAVTAAPPTPESLASRLRPTEVVPAPPALDAESAPVQQQPLLPASGALSAAAPPPVPVPKPAPAQPPAQQPAAQTPAPAPAQPPAQPRRVGGNVQEAVLLSRVMPVYPMLARQARVTGVVRVEATIGRNGKVSRARAVSGPPLLQPAAVQAVQKWAYKPKMLNGEPVECIIQVDVNFSLSH